MLSLPLRYAIKDLNGEELLAAGTLLDNQTLQALADRGRAQRYEAHCLLQNEVIRTDLPAFMKERPYGFIFGGDEGIREHLRCMGNIPLPGPLLAYLLASRKDDFYTYRHSLMVFALTTFLLKKSFGDLADDSEMLLVGPTHDLGKWAVPKKILMKTTPLTRSERSLLEFHPIAGCALLSYYLGDCQHPAVRVALEHHERRDGTGYPRGISELNPLVEMVATCDVYDALISCRPYRPLNYDNRTALEEITSIAETGALGWHSIQTLVGRNRKGYPYPDQVDVSLEKRGVPPAGNCYAKILED